MGDLELMYVRGGLGGEVSSLSSVRNISGLFFFFFDDLQDTFERPATDNSYFP